MDTKQYQRKQTTVEAVQLTSDNADEVAVWCGGQVVMEVNPETDRSNVGINVPTYLGPVRCSEGGFILKNARGRFEAQPFFSFTGEFEEAN